MHKPVFKTRLTDLLGIDHPVLCGGLMWLADGKYVAAVANAGAASFISALTFNKGNELREQIKICRDLCEDKPFGVNLFISGRGDEANERLKPLIDIVIDEKIPFVETAGGNPSSLVPPLKAANIKIIHKVPAVKFALSAERAGVDAVTIVGAECGGHPGYMLIGSMISAALGPQKLSIPVIIGGGIGTGSQLTAALTMGCDGVIMGTRMLVASEIWAHSDYKARICEGDGMDTALVQQIFKHHRRVLDNDAAKAVNELERQGITDFDQYAPWVKGENSANAYTTGDTSQGMIDYGQSACFANKIEPVEAIIDNFMDEARAASQVIAKKLA